LPVVWQRRAPSGLNLSTSLLASLPTSKENEIADPPRRNPTALGGRHRPKTRMDIAQATGMQFKISAAIAEDFFSRLSDAQ
jgi:hypothetical protein